MGLYVLLSLLALVGLVVTLTSQIDERIEELHQTQAVGFAEQLATELETSAPDQVLRVWSQSLAIHGYQVWLVDGALKSRVPNVEEVPVRAILQSAVRVAIRSGESVRWLQSEDHNHRTMVLARRCEPLNLPTSAVLLLSSPDFQGDDHRLFADAASRGAIFTWIFGVIVVAFIAMGLVSPLRVMTENLGSEVERTRRQDMLMRISDRHDELGNVAQSLTELEDDRQDRIKELEESQLRSSASVNLLTAVLDSMVEGVLAIDSEERILFLNAAARKLLSISSVIGTNHRLYEAVRIPAVLETIGDTLLTHEMQSLEFRSTRDGLHLALVVNPIRKGSHIGAVAVVRDISDVRRLEATRRDFVSGVSHELKTPLTVIQACTDTLLEGAIDDPVVARRFLKQVSEQSERLLQLILGMLQLARVESGSEVFDFKPIELEEVIDDVIAAMQPVVEPRGIRLAREGLSHLSVVCDWHAVRTIISNLTDNAIKHTLDGGEVIIELTNEDSGPGFLIRDTGVGIPQEHLTRIFERFYRVDRDRSRDRGGTGLGLAIVKHLCHTLNAVVSVVSAPGSGTEFRVKFPGESLVEKTVPHNE